LLKILKRQFAGEQILESVKQLFQVFTDKQLFVEWILQVLRAITLYFLKVKAGMEAEVYAVTNEKIDMRTVPPSIKKNIIHDEAVLKMRWDLCSGCEFLTDANKCQKCGCFMKVKHKFAQASCPVGKWGKHTERAVRGNFVTS